MSGYKCKLKLDTNAQTLLALVKPWPLGIGHCITVSYGYDEGIKVITLLRAQVSTYHCQLATPPVSSR